jgi:hypothetical protein
MTNKQFIDTLYLKLNGNATKIKDLEARVISLQYQLKQCKDTNKEKLT